MYALWILRGAAINWFFFQNANEQIMHRFCSAIAIKCEITLEGRMAQYEQRFLFTLVMTKFRKFFTFGSALNLEMSIHIGSSFLYNRVDALCYYTRK